MPHVHGIFEVVLHLEDTLTRGIPLSFGEGAQLFKPSRNGGYETPLPFQVGRDKVKCRRLLLVTPMGPA